LRKELNERKEDKRILPLNRKHSEFSSQDQNELNPSQYSQNIVHEYKRLKANNTQDGSQSVQKEEDILIQLSKPLQGEEELENIFI